MRRRITPAGVITACLTALAALCVSLAAGNWRALAVIPLFAVPAVWAVLGGPGRHHHGGGD